jgi:hypothetical protein
MLWFQEPLALVQMRQLKMRSTTPSTTAQSHHSLQHSQHISSQKQHI